jgi:hypothetical protein
MTNVIVGELKRLYHQYSFNRVYRKYAVHTIIPRDTYIRNLALARRVHELEGCIVECGVWRGGMIAGIADILGDRREYYLFDSFEGLPSATAIDGRALQAWQANINAPSYYNNCTAAVAEAETAMKKSSATRYSLVKGWFEDTLPDFAPPKKIALLRLDGDLYKSTVTCLKWLYPLVADEGIVIIDDYWPWDGCARAVHEFLANIPEGAEVPRIEQYENDVFFMAKRTQNQADIVTSYSAGDAASSKTAFFNGSAAQPSRWGD